MADNNFLQIMENIIFLKKTPIFSEVNTEDLKAISAIVKPVLFKNEDLIVKEGDPGDAMFIIKIGQVKITKGNGDKEVDLAVLPTASCFGDMILFEDAPRSANCYAVEDCTLLKLDKTDLVDVIMQHPRISIALFRMLGSRVREANQKLQQFSNKK